MVGELFGEVQLMLQYQVRLLEGMAGAEGLDRVKAVVHAMEETLQQFGQQLQALLAYPSFHPADP